MNNPHRKEEPTPKKAIALEDLESVECTLKDIDTCWLSLLRLSELMEEHRDPVDVSTAAYFVKIASRDIEANVNHVRACLRDDPQ